jgi:hypothetical protein
VLSRETGYERPYGRNPYEHYDTRRGPIAGFFGAALDQRLPAMERVVAIDLDGGAGAYAFSLVARRRVINDEIGALPLVVVWAPGTASALDAAAIRDGRDVGATAVFDRRLDGRPLTFEPAWGGRFRDRETGSVWLLSGRAVEGPLASSRLVPVPHGNHFWFAWAAFRPDARLVR